MSLTEIVNCVYHNFNAIMISAGTAIGIGMIGIAGIRAYFKVNDVYRGYRLISDWTSPKHNAPADDRGIESIDGIRRILNKNYEPDILFETPYDKYLFAVHAVELAREDDNPKEKQRQYNNAVTLVMEAISDINMTDGAQVNHDVSSPDLG